MSAGDELCLIRMIDGEFWECGKLMLQWDHENDPYYGMPRGIATCVDCDHLYWQKLKEAADARHRRKNGKVEH